MVDTPTVLVTGATGRVGSALLRRLVHAGVAVRALARDESKKESLVAQGIEAVSGDFLQPQTLPPVLDSVTAIFLLTPIHPEQVKQATNLIQAARDSDNPHVVRVSVHQASHQAPTRISRQHAEIEDQLKTSGLAYTLLRPQSFMQNILLSAPTVAAQGTIYQPMQDGRLGMIDARDIAEVAAKVLTEQGHEGKTYTLTGPAAISFHDVAETLSRALNRKITYVNVTLSTAKEAMLRRGIGEWMADALNEYAKAHSEGYSDWTTDDVQLLTGHRATSLETFAHDFARAFSAE